MTNDSDLDRAIAELLALTECRCDPAWTERDLHAPDCHADTRGSVDLLLAHVVWGMVNDPAECCANRFPDDWTGMVCLTCPDLSRRVGTTT